MCAYSVYMYIHVLLKLHYVLGHIHVSIDQVGIALVVKLLMRISVRL